MNYIKKSFVALTFIGTPLISMNQDVPQRTNLCKKIVVTFVCGLIFFTAYSISPDFSEKNIDIKNPDSTLISLRAMYPECPLECLTVSAPYFAKTGNRGLNKHLRACGLYKYHECPEQFNRIHP